ncbi:MAG: N-acetyl-gamma-glutamyl-phosphate reductase, partial [Ruminococcaceae bacterium]|nr:N-acetyl-gamma-glutamyl-phosphate reductase [Oscillospiraceae bacterium]
ADFRLDSEEEYTEWYGGNYLYPGLHEAAVYGLPELFRHEMAGRVIVGNPGCYPTASALALAPALKAGLIEPQGIIIDAKSGVSGAGRSLTQTSHFIDVNENFNAYKAGVHRHTPEIEQSLSKIAEKSIKITFVPHLLPVSRGILATCYAKATLPCNAKTLRNAYENSYGDEPFIRLLPDGKEACIRNVTLSNYCDISLHYVERTQTVIITSAIDNMIKGAAGQAIQNMNLILSMPETLGLEMIPNAF